MPALWYLVFLFGVAEWCVDSGFGLVWGVYLGFIVSWFGGLYLYLVLLWIPGYVGFCGVCLV